MREFTVTGFLNRERTPEAYARHERRAEKLAARISSVIEARCDVSGPVLDIGIAEGALTSRLVSLLRRPVFAIDRGKFLRATLKGAFPYLIADSSSLPFVEGAFAAVSFVDVYEHLLPERRTRVLAEIRRVLKPGGLLCGKIPNMNFPIEPHSYLPLVQFLPGKAEYWLYANLPSPTGERAEERRRGVHWYRATRRQFQRDVVSAGFRDGQIFPSSYDEDTLPARLRWLSPALTVFPAGYDFWYKKPQPAC